MRIRACGPKSWKWLGNLGTGQEDHRRLSFQKKVLPCPANAFLLSANMRCPSYRFHGAGNEPGKLFLAGHRHGY